MCMIAYPGSRTCVKRCRDLETKRSELQGHMTAQQGVHVLECLMASCGGGVLWFTTCGLLVLPSYPFYKFHPTPSPAHLGLPGAGSCQGRAGEHHVGTGGGCKGKQLGQAHHAEGGTTSHPCLAPQGESEQPVLAGLVSFTGV